MKDQLLQYHNDRATHRLVLLHGWGADATDLISIGKELLEPQPVEFELAALNAPESHPQGVGLQWYGLFPSDWQAVPIAVSDLKKRLEELVTPEIPLEKTFLLGFSQGGAMALAAGCELPLMGIIGCSAYPHPGWEPPHGCPSVLLLHGREDDVVPFSASKHLLKMLSKCSRSVELIDFGGGHCIPVNLIPSIQLALTNWLKE
ncbi:esterase [Prochlorococcus sp. MIT 1300]|uniref:alpha/beta hydrolase n=1 Tax=Prochlorococcus sp. MIT 1300 TaxID=3096218 RepID=UPI002A762246|nr:esterase [Prochlorococcus sp. MIT 1300]